MSSIPSPQSASLSTQVTYVILDWQEIPLRRGDSIDQILASVSDSPGVYAIEGCRDACPSPHILYVGQSGADGEPEGQYLSKRLRSSLARVLRSTTRDSTVDSWSDCWDLVLRWTTIATSPIRDVERLLIRGHIPPFNQHLVRGALPPSEEVVILNGGAKGRMLPVLSSRYFHADAWKLARSEDPGAVLTIEPPTEIRSLDNAVEDFRRKVVQRTLEQNKGNRTATAKALDVDVRTIFRFVEKERDEG